jgi:spore coat protein U-like protein
MNTRVLLHPRACGLAAALLAPVVAMPSGGTAAPTCSIDNVSNVAFGSYDVFSPAPVDTTGSVTYSCSGAGESDLVAIELSRGGAPSYFPRQLSTGGLTLDYNLYREAARTNVWGDGSGGTSRYTLVGTGNNDTVVVTLYGRIPALQNASVGTYGDTLTVTLLY